MSKGSKVGRMKIKSKSYKDRGIRLMNKLKKFRKYNIAKDLSDKEKQQKVNEFLKIQENRRK